MNFVCCKQAYGTDAVVCCAVYPVLRRAPSFTSHTVTTLTVGVDDFNYDGDGKPAKYVLQYAVSDRINTCSQ